MDKIIVVDVEKCLGCRSCEIACAVAHSKSKNLFEAVKENPVSQARVTVEGDNFSIPLQCRHCEDAPCISVCPVEALEKDEEGIIDRHTNLCISCKSCVTICPFGTMMTDFFKHHRNKDLYYDLNDRKEIELFIKACPPGVASLTESDESPAENIYKLNDKVLIREYLYTTEKP